MSDALSSAPSSPLLAALLARTSGAPNLPAHSRYLGLPTRTLAAADGSQIVYLSRRLVPLPDRFTVITTHTMRPMERLDQVAAAEFGDPCLAWRLCDANGALDPKELEHAGLRLNITLPVGVPGAANA